MKAFLAKNLGVPRSDGGAFISASNVVNATTAAGSVEVTRARSDDTGRIPTWTGGTGR